MAPEEIKGKKRKGAVDTSPKPKKQKKSSDAITPKKSPAKVAAISNDPPPKAKASRRQSKDLEEEAVIDEAPMEKKSKKKSKAVVNGDSETATEEVAPKEPSKKSRKEKSKAKVDTEESTAAAAAEIKKSKNKKSKAKEAPKEPSPEPELEEEESDSDEEEDDQTAALLAGFESDRDESDAEKDDEGLDADNFKDKVPKGLLKKTKSVSGNEEKSGVIYVGRIPHGFYESQMKAYFSQFGKVKRLRVSRNKKTGAPKHYAFVEFASSEVAEIVAKTMDKYLMFGHILQCSVIPPEQVHPNLFVGANQRFKKMPRNKMAGAEMTRGAERAVWEKRVAKEAKRRALKEKVLKEKFGYDYGAQALKAVEDVPKKAAALEDAPAQQLLTEARAAEENISEQVDDSKGTQGVPEIVKDKKVKKGGKRKAHPEADTLNGAETSEIEPKAPKVKKAKADAVKLAAPADLAEMSVNSTKEAGNTAIRGEKKRRSLSSADINGSKTKKTKKSKA